MRTRGCAFKGKIGVRIFCFPQPFPQVVEKTGNMVFLVWKNKPRKRILCQNGFVKSVKNEKNQKNALTK